MPKLLLGKVLTKAARVMRLCGEEGLWLRGGERAEEGDRGCWYPTLRAARMMRILRQVRWGSSSISSPTFGFMTVEVEEVVVLEDLE